MAVFVCQEVVDDVFKILTLVRTELHDAPIARRVVTPVPEVHELVLIAFGE